MRDEKVERKKQARSNKQTNKAKQHSTPKAVTFPVHVHVLYLQRGQVGEEGEGQPLDPRQGC